MLATGELAKHAISFAVGAVSKYNGGGVQSGDADGSHSDAGSDDGSADESGDDGSADESGDGEPVESGDGATDASGLAEAYLVTRIESAVPLEEVIELLRGELGYARDLVSNQGGGGGCCCTSPCLVTRLCHPTQCRDAEMEGVMGLFAALDPRARAALTVFGLDGNDLAELVDSLLRILEIDAQ